MRMVVAVVVTVGALTGGVVWWLIVSVCMTGCDLRISSNTTAYLALLGAGALLVVAAIVAAWLFALGVGPFRR